MKKYKIKKLNFDNLVIALGIIICIIAVFSVNTSHNELAKNNLELKEMNNKLMNELQLYKK